MKYYTQLLEKDTRFSHVDMVWHDTGLQREAMGTDAILILDGRCNLESMVRDSITRLKKMNNFINKYTGFRIMRGDSFQNSKIIYTNEGE